MAGLGPAQDKLNASIDLLWSMYSGPTFTAWLELWVAARTDPDLAVAFTGTVRESTGRQQQQQFVEMLAAETAVPPVGHAQVLAVTQQWPGPGPPVRRLRTGT